MTELAFEVVEDKECGYQADALGYPIHTFGSSAEELYMRVREAVEAYFHGPEGSIPTFVLMGIRA